MNHTQLRTFHAVASRGGFVAAADHLHLTQPAVSIQVRNLEDAYGVLLFDRSQGKVSLTSAGQTLYALTRELFAVEDQIHDFLNASSELDVGDLRISVDAPHLAMQLIAAFHQRYPNIRLDVSSGNTPAVWRDLMDGRADVVVAANPPDDKQIFSEPVRTGHLHALVPDTHPWSQKPTVALTDVATQPVILREPQSNTRQTLDRAVTDNRLAFDVVMELGSREATVEAVAAGIGIGFVFASEIDHDHRVKSIPLSGDIPPNIDSVATLNKHRKRNVVRAFFEIAEQWRSGNG